MSDTIPTGMVQINGGIFTMGSPSSEAGRYSDEQPQRQVTVSSFYMGSHEVTVAEFRRFADATGYRTEAEESGGGWVFKGSQWEMKADANWKNPYFRQGEDQPVVLVTWNDAVEYCNWLSQQEGLIPAYTINVSENSHSRTVTWERSANGYRLPTEAEWEYAARAGTTTRFNTGNDITTSQANFNNSRGHTTPVGNFAANAWGLYDMHGNVWEWCWDLYGAYPAEAQTDPTGPGGAYLGADRMRRGGHWVSPAEHIRCANRNNVYSSFRDVGLGFRLVRPHIEV